MCTVSFIRTNGKTIITSNRDEQVIRLAIEPQKYAINNKNLIFPKDPKAGGTWIVTDENNSVLVLLNGAEEKHIQKSNYKKSRGLIVLEMMGNKSVIDSWAEINLENVEPFTLVFFQENKLYQLRWNEIEKSHLDLDINKFHIWSSSTLYSKSIQEKRTKWFYDFLEDKTSVSEDNMLDFHLNREHENQEIGLVINKNNQLKTLSITQIIIESVTSKMRYFDLIKNEAFTIPINPMVI
jgi:Transport and Golgi organisation 2